jgi:hypothetical protein
MFYVEGMNVIVASPGESVNDALRHAEAGEPPAWSSDDLGPGYEEQVERVEVVIGPTVIDGVKQAKAVHPSRHLVVHEALELRRTTAVVRVLYREAGHASHGLWHRARLAVDDLFRSDDVDRARRVGRLNRRTLGRYHRLFKSLAF